MALHEKQIIRCLKDTEVFCSCSSRDLARILPSVSEIRLNPDEVLFQSDSPADTLYLLLEGRIVLKSKKRILDEVTSGTIGEEIIDDKGKYLSDAIAVSSTTVLSIPREHLTVFFETNPVLKSDIYSNLINHLSGKTLRDDRLEQEPESAPPEKSSALKIIGWILSIIVPAIILYLGDSFGLDWKGKIFLTVASSTIMMWIFRLAHEFIPSIFAVLVILILDIAPPSVALSGFTSGSFFMALSIFGLSAVLISSGLTYRIVITLLRFVPLSQFWYTLTIFFTGIFLTPLFPSANGRISLASPILEDMVDSLGYKKSDKAATRLSVATFAGFTLFSGIFLSSKSIHFVIFGLLPIQVQEQFNWGYWLYASLAAGAVLFILYMIVTGIMFHNREIPRLSKDQIEAQRNILGPMSPQEWAALGGIVLFLIGIATSSIHKIQLPWIGLTVLYVVLALEFLSKKEFKMSIDWTFLIFLGTLIGLVKSMSYIGLDQQIGQHLIWLGDYTRTNFPLFVLLLSLCIFVLRLFIPNNATVAILASVFLPIAEISGINPWVVGFIILMMSDAWFMPYQCTYYLLFEELTGKKKLFDKTSLLQFNLVSVLFRLAAVYASIPFWRFLGIL
jgi:DASS family divalent anion:Na+ symporter